MSRHTGWMRIRTDPDTPRERVDLALGRKVLGELMENLARGGLYQGTLRREFADGTLVIARFDGTTPIVQVIKPGGEVPEVVPILVDLWIPHGFVLTPGDDDAPGGYGLPVLQDTDPGSSSDPFALKNLQPGMDKDRWTKAGKCAQVLVTGDDTSDYPRQHKRRLPIGFDAKEWREGAYKAPPGDTWHGVRARFNGFTWYPPTAGARQQLWRELAKALGKPVALPFDGYYDDAQLFADMLATYGTDETQWPLSYRSTAARAGADGLPKSYREASSANQAPVPALVGFLGTVPDGCPLLDLGEQRGFVTATLREPGEWIRAGNQHWTPTDADLPRVSWDGYPAQNLPDWLTRGRWLNEAGSGPFPLESWTYLWRGRDVRGIFTRNLYCRGRCIGVLPATVVSAGVYTFTKTVTVSGKEVKRKYDQIRVITWDPAKQPQTSSQLRYMWNFDVWYLEVARDATIPLHLSGTPIGAYDKVSNPTGWIYAGPLVVDPNGAPYDGDGVFLRQFWRFSGDGSKLVAAYQNGDGSSSSAHGATILSVAPGVLDLDRYLAASPPAGEYASIVAIDFDEHDNLVSVRVRNDGVADPEMGPNGHEYDLVSRYIWSEGGQQEVSLWNQVGGGKIDDLWVVEKWVMDARHGAMLFADHWYQCSEGQQTATPLYRIRMTLEGARVVNDTIYDPSLAAGIVATSDNFMDRILAQYAGDDAGNWIVGYELGATAGATTVINFLPPCPVTLQDGMLVLSPTTQFIASRWLTSFGNLQTVSEVSSGALRAYPIGVL